MTAGRAGPRFAGRSQPCSPPRATRDRCRRAAAVQWCGALVWGIGPGHWSGALVGGIGLGHRSGALVWGIGRVAERRDRGHRRRLDPQRDAAACEQERNTTQDHFIPTPDIAAFWTPRPQWYTERWVPGWSEATSEIGCRGVGPGFKPHRMRSSRNFASIHAG